MKSRVIRISGLPETLVTNHEVAYFDYFFAAISAHPEAITSVMRNNYAKAYRRYESQKKGFDWYRAFYQDTAENSKARTTLSTPLLYLHGKKKGGNSNDYKKGFEAAGLTRVTTTLVHDNGHFAP